MEHTISKLNALSRSARAVGTRTLVAGRSAWRRLTRPLGMNAVIATFCAALLIAIWSGAIIGAQREREKAIAAAIRQNSNLAAAFEEQTIRMIK